MESLSKTGLSKDFLLKKKEAKHADELFFSAEEYIQGWSISKEQKGKRYGEMMPGYDQPMAQISDKNYLFVAKYSGY